MTYIEIVEVFKEVWNKETGLIKLSETNAQLLENVDALVDRFNPLAVATTSGSMSVFSAYNNRPELRAFIDRVYAAFRFRIGSELYESVLVELATILDILPKNRAACGVSQDLLTNRLSAREFVDVLRNNHAVLVTVLASLALDKSNYVVGESR